jgi:MFS family permease
MDSRMASRDRWTLVILVLVSIFLMADQNAMNPVVKEIMAEYSIDEGRVGMVGSAFTILGALVSIFFGYFSDRFSRRRLFAFSVLLGEIPCFLTGVRAFTQTYEQLLFWRGSR